MHLILILALLGSVFCENHHYRTNQLPYRSTIVHLFEWKWLDIAEECERFLAPKGFGGVQISPPSENVIIHQTDGSRPWYERYQPMSYILTTRSGNEEEFLNMTARCNAVGVRIYADVVVNHMTGNVPSNIGTAGSRGDFENYSYPAVPYTADNFHTPHCGINNYNNATEVRSCELVALKDLNHAQSHVRNKITDYLNHLIADGVAGFRVDAAKHMWPEDLKVIYSQLDDLNTEFGFPPNTKPYIYQEVIYYGNEPITPAEYTALGDVTEFRVGNELKNVFRGNNALKWLVNWGPGWNLSPSETALVFIDNHDTQRQSDVLTYKESRAYKGAVAFMLAHPYGEPRVMSSYFFENSDQGPPSNTDEEILSPIIFKNDTCGNGWVCEHRWRQIYQMVAFRNAVRGYDIANWWDNGNNQIAFSRGDKGFIAFNLESTDLNRNLQTGLPDGEYCDVISGTRRGNSCTGTKVTVFRDGTADIVIPANAEDIMLAIHVGPESSLHRLHLDTSSSEEKPHSGESGEQFEHVPPPGRGPHGRGPDGHGPSGHRKPHESNSGESEHHRLSHEDHGRHHGRQRVERSVENEYPSNENSNTPNGEPGHQRLSHEDHGRHHHHDRVEKNIDDKEPSNDNINSPNATDSEARKDRWSISFHSG